MRLTLNSRKNTLPIRLSSRDLGRTSSVALQVFTTKLVIFNSGRVLGGRERLRSAYMFREMLMAPKRPAVKNAAKIESKKQFIQVLEGI
ncbi:hypothetical protein AVEN_24000-1 [Araneus ventricosus]|uniref:Uncharacterized protein n=1 Tax=Araneus ventricosus TaxID=182803 RepID=A0A4Y2D211_ARAVE|nr:hypothetical protein AVEN_24000-1 [Araneus ventricosus]